MSDSKIREAIKILARTDSAFSQICTVDAVDEDARTVDCTPIDESAPLLGVNLQGNQEGDEGVVLFPAIGSYVIVSFIAPCVAVVVATDTVDKIVAKIGKTTAQFIDGQVDIAVQDTTVKITSEGVVINGGVNGGMVKIQNLTKKLNEFITAFNSHTHELPTGAVAVTGSATAQANTAPVVVPPITSHHNTVTASDYEDEKVRH